MPRLIHWTAAFVLALLPAGASAQTVTFDDGQTAEIEAIIHDYLMAHPEVVFDALTLFQKQQEQAQIALQREQLQSLRADIMHRETTPVIGNPEGDVTLVEFFDYQCMYCKGMVDRVVQLMEDDPNLRVVMKEFPILGPASQVAARAALASQIQGKYAEFHDALMRHEGQLTEDAIFQTAESVGLDVKQLRRDMESPEIAAEIDANLALAQSIGVRGTPAFIVGDELVPGAVGLEVLQQLIEEQRAG